MTSTTLTSPAQVSAPPRQPPLPALTGLRTLLALDIILFHFTPPHPDFLSIFINNGFVFVGWFFLISGFILSYNYSPRAATLVSRDFWLARFARLYPVYLLVLILSFPMLQAEWFAHSRADFWRGLILTPLLMQGWSPSLATFWNTVAWTLSSEVLLYLAFPYIIRGWSRHLPWLSTPARLIALFFALWIIGLLPHTAYLLLNPDHLAVTADRYTYGFWIRFLRYTPFPYICTFLAGVTLGKLHLALTLTPRQRLALATTGLTALLVAFYTIVPHVPYVLLHGALLLPLFATLILGLSAPHPLTTLFSWKPLVLLGETTYCLYLLHFNAFILIHKWNLPQRLHVASLDPWISYIVLILLAVAAHHLVENPARKFILRRTAQTS